MSVTVILIACSTVLHLVYTVHRLKARYMSVTVILIASSTDLYPVYTGRRPDVNNCNTNTVIASSTDLHPVYTGRSHGQM